MPIFLPRLSPRATSSGPQSGAQSLLLAFTALLKSKQVSVLPPVLSLVAKKVLGGFIFTACGSAATLV